MNGRTQLLAGLAALGCVAALAATFLGGGVDVVKPLRTAASASSPAPAGSPGAAPRSGYDAFRLFHARNVFDPDRRPLRVAANGDTPPPATPPPARTDFVALTGTMLDHDRSLAFFSGSRAEYNKVLAVRDRIVGAEITDITPVSIEIDRAGQKTRVSVGQTVPFDGNAAPGLAPAPEAFASAPSTGSAAAVGGSPGVNGNASASTGPASSSKQDEIRRRMEERRRQEQK